MINWIWLHSFFFLLSFPRRVNLSSSCRIHQAMQTLQFLEWLKSTHTTTKQQEEAEQNHYQNTHTHTCTCERPINKRVVITVIRRTTKQKRKERKEKHKTQNTKHKIQNTKYKTQEREREKRGQKRNSTFKREREREGEREPLSLFPSLNARY